MKYIHELHNMMLEHNLILAYNGEFTQEITKSVLAMAERNMDSVGEESSIKRKVFNVMVECLQNIVKHAEDMEDPKKRTAIFMIGKIETEYIILSGNLVKEETRSVLQNKLDQINDLDKDGLKSLYKNIIKSSDSLSDKGGAGLGFVDMARKSGNPLEYHFSEVERGISFFALKTTISREV